MDRGREGGVGAERDAAVPSIAGVTPFPTRIVSVTLTGSNRESIGGALASVVDWVDLCLVIDTGAEDDNLEVARWDAGDKFVRREFSWIDDFAAARNSGLAAAAAVGGDWAVMLDTDERLDLDGPTLRAALAAAGSEAVFVAAAGGTYGKERFFKLPASGRFSGATHEFYASAEERTRWRSGATFDELPKSAEEYRRKFERDAAILARSVEAHPNDPRWRYYLGDALQHLGQLREAIAGYRACAALKGWDEEGAWACYRAAECSIGLGEPEAAVESCAAGMARHAGLAELPWLAGYASWQAGRPAQAVYWARAAAALGWFQGVGRTVPRLGFRYPPALYEGPYDVLRYAPAATGDEAGAAEAARLLAEARAAREAAASDVVVSGARSAEREGRATEAPAVV